MMLMSGIYTFRKLVLLVLGICWLNTLGAAEPEKVVYKVDIKDEIGGVWPENLSTWPGRKRRIIF